MSNNNYNPFNQNEKSPQQDNSSQNSPQPPNTLPSPPNAARQRQWGTFLRFAIVFFMGLVLLIPLLFLEGKVREREGLYTEAINEIESSWGGYQLVAGPMLVIPFTTNEETVEFVERKGKQEKITKVHTVQWTQILLPKKISFKAELLPEERYLGIYSTSVYSAPIQIEGEFEIPEKFLNYSNLKQIHWNSAVLVCGIPEIRASRNQTLTWEGKEQTLLSGTGVLSELPGMSSGFNAQVQLNDVTKKYSFTVNMKLMGSRSLGFTPVGETSVVQMQSTWPSPNFVNWMLPDEREVTANGFKASWNVSALNRSYPQTAELKEWPESWSSAVVASSLFEPVSLYQKITRAVKYGVLFIAVTFIGFLAFELVSQRRLHYVQYGLVGLSMVLFFLSLLSLSEHLLFIWAYAIASLIVVAMISFYIGAAMRSLRHGLIMAVLMTILYITLYILLQLEDYAMLMGTAIILIMVGVLMWVTRGINRENNG